MIKLSILQLITFLLTVTGFSQKVELLVAHEKTSFRGLSVVNNNIVWVSGNNGQVGKTIDGGKTWEWFKVAGFSKTDFRDIEAFDKNNAIIMGIDTPAIILKTSNGGKDWKVVYKNNSPGMFLDAMAFWNIRSGIVIGDPIEGKFFVARTFDGGDNWQDIPVDKRPIAAEGEACFASSGTNIQKLTKAETIFVSGGKESNVFIRYRKIALPMVKGLESTGANSVAVKNKKEFMVVGGDFTKKDSSNGNCVATIDGGLNFTKPVTPPHGYRSCIIYLKDKTWITCGLSGVDFSKDDGKNFELISTESFHAVQKAKKGNAVYFSGTAGKIGKLVAE